MKKIVLFPFLVSLVGCSAYNSMIDKFYNYDGSVAVNPDDSLDNPDQDGEVVLKDKPTAKLKLTYYSNKHEIRANIITNWNGVPQGIVYLTWIAPKNTSCYSTSFPIAKFNEEEDYTFDSQSVLDNGKICKGKWTAVLTDKSDNSEIAKDSVEVQ